MLPTGQEAPSFSDDFASHEFQWLPNLAESVSAPQDSTHPSSHDAHEQKANAEVPRRNRRNTMQAYEELGASPSDDAKTLRQKYRQSMKLKHPDKGGDHEDFLEMQAAAEKLAHKRSSFAQAINFQFEPQRRPFEEPPEERKNLAESASAPQEPSVPGDDKCSSRSGYDFRRETSGRQGKDASDRPPSQFHDLHPVNIRSGLNTQDEIRVRPTGSNPGKFRSETHDNDRRFCSVEAHEMRVHDTLRLQMPDLSPMFLHPVEKYGTKQDADGSRTEQDELLQADRNYTRDMDTPRQLGVPEKFDKLRSEIWEGINALLGDPEKPPDCPDKDVVVVPSCARCATQPPGPCIASENELLASLAARVEVMEPAERSAFLEGLEFIRDGSSSAQMQGGQPAQYVRGQFETLPDGLPSVKTDPERDLSTAPTPGDATHHGLTSSSAERCVYSLGRKLNRALADSVEKDRKIKQLQENQRSLISQLSEMTATLREREMELDTSQRLAQALGIQLELLKRQTPSTPCSMQDASVQTEN